MIPVIVKEKPEPEHPFSYRMKRFMKKIAFLDIAAPTELRVIRAGPVINSFDILSDGIGNGSIKTDIEICEVILSKIMVNSHKGQMSDISAF